MKYMLLMVTMVAGCGGPGFAAPIPAADPLMAEDSGVIETDSATGPDSVVVDPPDSGVVVADSATVVDSGTVADSSTNDVVAVCQSCRDSSVDTGTDVEVDSDSPDTSVPDTGVMDTGILAQDTGVSGLCSPTNLPRGDCVNGQTDEGGYIFDCPQGDNELAAQCSNNGDLTWCCPFAM